MNIKKAKEQIENAMRAYFAKDDMGSYKIPPERQRPVFLMGPPGIGKTAIMEQIAQELGVGLISYSMTHHTRQSALGLPFITKKNYGGVESSVSEYTMSEIIAAVYDMMEASGVTEGILFLDEINCVSETLAPVMLQFLQYKVFGRHSVPEGWLVVTAGNPPEYNKSVRDFDIVTWDRLKRIDVEPDFDVWKEYAYARGVHPAVMTYLELKKEHFYVVENTAKGRRFVTARGWDDLSTMIKLYEEQDIEVDSDLVAQYLQDPEIAAEFSIYYDLFKKYRSDYQVDAILAGADDEGMDALVSKAAYAGVEERLSFLGILLDTVSEHVRAVVDEEKNLKSLLEVLRKVKAEAGDKAAESEACREILNSEITELERKLEKGKAAGNMSREDAYAMKKLIAVLKTMSAGADASFGELKAQFNDKKTALDTNITRVRDELTNAFLFCDKAFGSDREMLIFVTELTGHYHCAWFISKYGCDEYYKHSKEMELAGKQAGLLEEIEELEL